MQWSEVFDKCFNFANGMVLVFIPGSYTGTSIRYAWTTREIIDSGLDYSLLSPLNYSIGFEEIRGPGGQFSKWEYIKLISQQERICNKIKVMEDRWKKFQDHKKSKKEIKTGKPKIKRGYNGVFRGYEWSV